MKKIIALVLALVMMASMSVVAFAAKESIDGTDRVIVDDEEPIEGHTAEDVYVTYTVTKGYTVTIPDKFNLEEQVDTASGLSYGTGTGTVTINAAKIDGNETLSVTVTGNTVEGKDYNNADITTKWMLIDTKGKSKSVGYTFALTGDQTSTNFEQGKVVVDYAASEGPVSSTGISTKMDITTNNTPQAGTYQDTLTFVVKLEAK